MNTEELIDKYLINDKPIEQGEDYTDGINIYWVIGFNESNATVCYIVNPPDGEQLSKIIDTHKHHESPFKTFKNMVKSTYLDNLST